MRAEYKVPGGKLVAAETRLSLGVVTDVKITGDFFMHPEEDIYDLEKTLTGIRSEEVTSAVNRFFAVRRITLFGVSPEDFAHVLRLSLDNV